MSLPLPRFLAVIPRQGKDLSNEFAERSCAAGFHAQGPAMNLASTEFWRSADCALMTDSRHRGEDEALAGWLRGQDFARAGLVFRTSGTGGEAKRVVIARRAFLASASAVNSHLAASADDVWLCPLPTHHVGGLAIFARAWLAGSSVHALEERWNPGRFIRRVNDVRATLASLVPTQAHDLVAERMRCPNSLRAVLVGGADLSPDLEKSARALGWPILRTYGMTETSSQVATQSLADGGDWLPVLPIWRGGLTSEGRLRVKGEALFSGYVMEDGGSFRFLDPKEEGWFTTRDFVELEDGRLRFVGREAHALKIRGKLVSLLEARASLGAVARSLGIDERGVTLAARPDARDGSRLICLAEAKTPANALAELLDRFNAGRASHERVEATARVGRLPRTELGKLAEEELSRLAAQAG